MGPEGATPDPASGATRLEQERQRNLRLQADFENHRKRVQRERESFLLYANEGLMRDILPVLDDLERAVKLGQSADPEVMRIQEPLLKGLHLVIRRCNEVLERHGVRSVDATGQLFDPGIHEAVMQTTDPRFGPGTVVEVLERGYKVHNRLLRPARVAVNRRDVSTVPSAAPAAPAGTAASAEDTAPSGPAPMPAPSAAPKEKVIRLEEESVGSIESWEKEFNS